MTDPRQKNPREGDPSNEERDRDRVTNPNRRQDEDEMNEESQRGGGQRSREKDYGSTESKPGERREEQGGRKPTDPTRKQ